MASRWWEFLDKLKAQEPPPNILPSQDERYTLAYIQRETVLLLRYIKRGRHHVFSDMRISIGEMDDRILRRWGLR